MGFITSVIEKQPEIGHPTVRLLLEQYNRNAERPIILIEKEEVGCFSSSLVYVFYRAVEDMPNHYELGGELSASDTINWLSNELNQKI